MRNSAQRFTLGFSLALALAVTLILLATTGVQQVATLALLWLLPTLAWTQVVAGSRGERLALGGGLALLLNALATLLVHYLPGAPPRMLLLAAAIAVAALPLAIPEVPTSCRQKGAPASCRHRLTDILILAGAFALRLLYIGYKEIQGDEGIVLVRAAAALTGDDAILFLHQKGPLEILLPLQSWGLTGQTHEFWLRLPFAWAGLLGILALWLLGRRWFGLAAGRWAALLFALVGFAVAFSRIVQYQSLVVLFGTLALLAAQRYRTDGRALDLLLSGLFFGGGLLAHYDAVLVAPALGWVLIGRAVAEGRIAWRAWGVALAAGIATVALFYLPYVLNPNFARTLAYLTGDRLGVSGDGAAGGDLAGVWRMLTFYNSTLYIVGLALLIGAALVWLWRTRRGMAPVLLWLTPTLFYTLIVSDGRTHVYTIFAGGCLLAGLAIACGIDRLANRRRLQTAAAVALGAWLFVSGAYLYLIMIDHTPERQRTWERNRPPFNPTTWAEPPRFGLFGFPYQAGWRVASGLVADDLPYASNEEEEITNWYMGQAARTHCNDYTTFLLAEHVQDAIAYDPAQLDGLHLHNIVTVGGEPKLRIYKRVAAAEVTTLAADGAVRWLTPQQVAPPLLTGAYPLGVELGGRARLLGYDLDDSHAYPGGELRVTLYWQALVPFMENYQSFVHFYDGSMWGQDDGSPECGINPTTRWEPGQIIPDLRTVAIAADAPLDRPIPLLAGMYNLLDQTRLPVVDYPNDLIPLTTLTLRQPPPTR